MSCSNLPLAAPTWPEGENVPAALSRRGKSTVHSCIAGSMEHQDSN